MSKFSKTFLFDDENDLLDLEFLESVENRNSLHFQETKNDFFTLDSADFHQRYRLTKETFSYLHNLIEQSLRSKSERVSALTPMQQLLVAIRFYASGSYQINVGDLSNISQSSCCRIVQRVSRCLAGMRPDFISMPDDLTQCQKVSKEFYEIGGFPDIIGAINCTHVRIQSPGGENSESFRNREGFMSINVQTVVDANLFARNIVARWPGSAHDSTIFNASLLRKRLESGEFPKNFHLIGDSEYTCSPYLLTPLSNPTSPSEIRYNASHTKTRNCIKRKYRLLKQRFPCLYLGLRNKLDTTIAIIVACAVLDNLCIKLNDPLPEVPPEVQAYIDASDIPIPAATSQETTAGHLKRVSVIASYF